MLGGGSAGASLLSAAPAPASCLCDGSVRGVRTGPRVTAASISHGTLHETLTFHAAGRFTAFIESNPPASLQLNKTLSLNLVRKDALGYHPAGRGKVSIPLGALSPGRYAVFVAPRPPSKASERQSAATWVYFTESTGGSAANVRLIQPK